MLRINYAKASTMPANECQEHKRQKQWRQLKCMKNKQSQVELNKSHIHTYAPTHTETNLNSTLRCSSGILAWATIGWVKLRAEGNTMTSTPWQLADVDIQLSWIVLYGRRFSLVNWLRIRHGGNALCTALWKF